MSTGLPTAATRHGEGSNRIANQPIERSEPQHVSRTIMRVPATAGISLVLPTTDGHGHDATSLGLLVAGGDAGDIVFEGDTHRALLEFAQRLVRAAEDGLQAEHNRGGHASPEAGCPTCTAVQALTGDFDLDRLGRVPGQQRPDLRLLAGGQR